MKYKAVIFKYTLEGRLIGGKHYEGPLPRMLRVIEHAVGGDRTRIEGREGDKYFVIGDPKKPTAELRRAR